jgi:Cof subfamily protein (haloacid dehalogenase superfamily)
MYKLLCTDMDGTLINGGGISERTLKAIEKAHAAGVKIALSTGRIYANGDYFAGLIKAKAPVIACNGGYIREKDRGKILHKSAIGFENCMKIIEILKDFDAYPHFYTCDSIFTKKIIHSSSAYEKGNALLPKKNQVNINIVEDWEKVLLDNGDEIIKFMLVDLEQEKIKAMREALSSIDTLEMSSSSNHNVEMMNKGVSKGNAVEMLASYYQIDRSEIICVGDHENDISMIEYAGLGIAMGNAEEFVKNVAEYVTDTNKEDGVAKIIEKFILAS